MFKKLTPNLMVENVAKTIDFYRDILGFEVLTTVEGDNETAFAIMQRDNVELMFQSRNSLSENVPALAAVRLARHRRFTLRFPASRGCMSS